jgi:two-component system, response regulator PdtaR
MRPNLKRPHVLLVDDEALIRMTTADLLTDAGFDVEEAGSADEALKLVDEAHPVDVLVTDVEMPGRCNGCSLAWRIRALSPKVGVLVISGVARPAPDELPEGTYFSRQAGHPRATPGRRSRCLGCKELTCAR